MSQRSLVFWIAVQTLLGLWFAWLLWCSPPVRAAAQPSANDSVEQRRIDDLQSPESSDSDTEAGSPPRRRLEREPAAAPTDPAGLVLFGQITDPSGKPVEKALLSARQLDVFRGAVESGPTGAYALAGLLPGDANVLVRTKGYRNYIETITLDEGRNAHRRDIVLQPTVELDVIAKTPEGKALEPELRAAGISQRVRLNVVITHERPERFPAVDSHFRVGIGRFRAVRFYGRRLIAGAPPEMLGVLEVDGDLPAYASLVLGHVLLATELVNAYQKQLKFRVPVDAVRGKLATVQLQLVAAETGRPLGGVRVDGVGLKMTDADGIAVFEGIVPGILRLRAQARDREPLDRVVRVEPGGRTDLGRIPLYELRRVSVLVVDAAGKGTKASLMIHHLDERNFPQPLQDTSSVGVDATGRVELRLGPRRYAVHANKGREMVGHALLDLTSDVPKELRIQLQPVRKVKVVKQFSRDRVYLLSVRTRAGLPVYGDFVYAGSDQTLLLPEGEYTVDIHEDSSLVRSFTMAVGVAVIHIRLP